jgi:gluconate 5-dehydrogenase
MAEALGEMGADIAISARKRDELTNAVEHLKKLGIRSEAFVSDVGDRNAITPLTEAVLARFGKVDVLVNNAGAAWEAPAEDYPLDGWDKLVNLNLTGAFLLSQQIARQSMIPRRWGRIINIASIAGLAASDPRVAKTVAYIATKHGLIGLTRQLAAEWGEYNIVVNAICPGYFPSKMTHTLIDSVGSLILATTPTQRLGNEEDLKGVVVLLASEAARHITGQAVAVDGGATVF